MQQLWGVKAAMGEGGGEGVGRSYFLKFPHYTHTFSVFTGGYLLRVYPQPGMCIQSLPRVSDPGRESKK